MTIVQINADYNRGSIGRTTSEVHEYLLNHNHNSYVFTCDFDDQPNNIHKIGNSFDHSLHAFMSRLTGMQGYFSHIPTFRLLLSLDYIKPDIVHLRNLHNNYVNVPMLLSYLAKNDIAVVITLHDCWFLTGKCCYYTNAKCIKWQTECGHCPLLKSDNISWFFDKTARMHREKMRLLNSIPRLAIVGNSEWTTVQAQNSAIYNAKIIKKIYNWIDMNTFSYHDPKMMREKLNIKKEDFIVLGVAIGWSERKGLGVFEKLAIQMPNVKFLLVGIFFDDHQLPSNIIKYGKTNNPSELCELYSLADVFLNPSLQETFGKVTAEAMCCGTPSIVNNATANPELIGPGCGYVVDNNNIEEYIDYINKIKILGKPYFSQSCLKFTKEYFSKEDGLYEYIKLYEYLRSI